MKIKKIGHIASIMFKEMVRDKVFISLSAASILLVLASLILNEMVVGQQIKATKDLGLSVLNLFSLFILIFLGVNLVSRDLNNKSLYFLFSKPVNRSEYLLGSSISILSVVMAGIVVIAATVFFLSFLQQESWLAGLLTAVFLTLLEMILLLSFAVFFVLIASPQLAMFLTLLIYVIGHTISHALQVVEHSGNTALKYVILVLHSLLPNLDYFNKKPEILYNLPIPAAYFLDAALYSLTYSILVFVISIQIFKRKEI